MRRLVVSVILLALFVQLPQWARGQMNSATFSMGHIIPTAPDQHPISMGTSTFDYAVSWRTEGNDYWKIYHRYPDFGFRLSACKMPHGIAGNRYGAVGFMEVPITNVVDWTVGLGFSAYTKPFSKTGDKDNGYIGSIVNCLFDMGMVYKLPFEDGRFVTLQARFLHTSNGYIHKPNMGLNFWQLGLGYDISPERNIDSVSLSARMVKDSVEQTFEPLDNIFVSYAPGIVQSRHSLKDGYYYCYTGEIGYIRRFHPCHAWGANLDIMMNGSHPEWLVARKEQPPLAYLGLCAIYEGYYGPMSIRLSIGSNLTGSSLIYIPVYERVALFYHFGRRDRQYAGISMKAYMGHVDYLEWTYGFHIPVGRKNKRVG